MKIWKAGLIVISIVTVIFISVIVYANANSSNYNDVGYDEVVLAAEPSPTQPSSWKTPEELGIIEIKEQQGWLQVLVPEEKAKQLQDEQPVFKYKDKFYQISPLWTTPALPESVLVPASVGIGAGWIFVGALFFRERRKAE